MATDMRSLRTRIKSIDSTMHLTKAMGLVASSKIRRANEHMLKSRQYAAAVEETVALLAYMVTHNQHHAEELHELAHSVEGEAAQLLHEAVVDLTVGNEKLAEALRILKGEE